MNKSLLCSLVLLVVFLFASTVFANSCTKTFTVKGKDYKFDLNGLSSTDGYQAKGADGYNYYISFCSAVTAPAASCAKDGSYKGWQLSDDKNNCFPIAMGGDDGVSMELIDPDNVEGGILIKMKTVDGTYNRGAEIQLSCQKKTKIGDVSVTEKKDGLYTSIYHFNMKSSYACIGGGSSGGRKCALGCVYGVGGLLMTLSLVALILYFIIGFVLCKFVWKKEGMEVIPNVEFWKDLPFLLKDGAMFWVDLFRSVTKKGQYTEVTA